MKLNLSHVVLGLGVLAGTAVTSRAAIERLDLGQMVTRSDNAVIGTIVDRHVIRIDHPKDGPQLYYTSLTISGRSLRDDQPVTVDVWFGGGFVNEKDGVFNSEAPSADDQRIGNQIVAFYKFEPNMGGDLSGNALMCWHGGLYRTFENRVGQMVVQGRGDGYAIESNVTLNDLTAKVKSIVAANKKAK